MVVVLSVLSVLLLIVIGVVVRIARENDEQRDRWETEARTQARTVDKLTAKIRELEADLCEADESIERHQGETLMSLNCERE